MPENISAGVNEPAIEVNHPGSAGHSPPKQTIPVLLVVFGLILLMPIPTGMTPEGHRLIAVTFLMGGLWISQAIPLAATSLLPLGLFPLLRIMPATAVSKAFINDTVFLYMGGMLIALGIERWQLHRRIALNLVAVIGIRPKRMILGFMITSAVLSMWISNTACTLMMLPIALAMLKTLDGAQQSDASLPRCRLRSDQLAVPLLLSISYASSLGGMTTLVGTPTNNAAVGIYRDQIPGAAEITLAQWLLAVGPIGLIYLAVTWFVLTRGLAESGEDDQAVEGELRNLLRGLGRPSSAERRMLVVFGMTGCLWVFRQPLKLGDVTLIPGWVDAYATAFNWFTSLSGVHEGPFDAAAYISDSSIAVLMATLLFFLPSGTGKPREPGADRQPSPKLMDWETAGNLPWDMILLFGGGFALAEAFRTTELSAWLGQALQGPLQQTPPWVVVASICTSMTFLTEFTSNVATVSTLMPTLLAMSEPLGLDPRMLFIPATLAASCAFMMPIATPPNAIVFGSGRIPIRAMVRYGLLLNLLGVPLLTLAAFWCIGPALGIPDAADQPDRTDVPAEVEFRFREGDLENPVVGLKVRTTADRLSVL